MRHGGSAITDPAPEERADRTSGDLAAFLIMAFILGFGGLSLFRLSPNTDIGWVIHVGQRLAEGAILYQDIIEIHPPLLFWTSARVALIARAAGLEPAAAFDVFILLYLLTCLALTWLVTGHWRAPAALAFVGIPLVGLDAGEPEHLFALAFIPYMLLAELRLQRAAVSPPLAVAIGALTGVGICLKPHFALGWLTVEAVLLKYLGVRHVVRRWEVACVAAVGVTYVLCVLLAAPDYLTIARYAALAYADYYPARAIDIITNRYFATVLLMIGAALVLDRTRRTWVAVATGCSLLVAVFIQGHGWNYHYYPAIAVSAFAACCSFIRRRWAAAVVLPLAAGMILWTNLWFYELRPWPYLMPWLRDVVRAHGGPVLGLTTLMQPMYPLLTLEDVEPVSRFASLWPIPQAYDSGGAPFPYNQPGQMNELERFAFEAVVADFLRARPGLVLVDTLPPRMWPPERKLSGWSWLHYFGQDARFLAEFERSYTEIPSIANYRLFVRRTPTVPIEP